MSSEPHGLGISGVEVTNVSTRSIWLVAGDKELFLSYEDFPWFKDQPLSRVLSVEEPSPGHFFRPELDVDLGVESIENPERFPLTSKASSA